MANALPWASRSLPVRSRVTATAYLPDSLYRGKDNRHFCQRGWQRHGLQWTWLVTAERPNLPLAADNVDLEEFNSVDNVAYFSHI
jgi:hypothetical protein